jgi:pimeloyl-ACP methyl ester carboxylesterase
VKGAEIMQDRRRLTISGYQGRTIDNTFHRQKSDTDHLAVIYPGYGYTQEMPLLYYTSRLILSAGADLLQVKYAYTREPAWEKVSDGEREAWLNADAFAAWEEGWKQRTYQQVTLIGKSLGALAAAHVASNDTRLPQLNCIFLTPVLSGFNFAYDLNNAQLRNLIVIGTDDHFYNADVLRDLERQARSELVVIRGADHSLEFKKNPIQSAQALEYVLRAEEKFLKDARLG